MSFSSPNGPRDVRPKAELRRPRAWPFYLVCDVSSSMYREDVHGTYTPWHVIRDGLADLLDEINHSMQARDRCHLSIIAFSDEVQTVLPLTPFRYDGLQIPSLPKGVYTNYAKVFRHLNSAVASDFANLSKSYQVDRPVVFFVTDGRPEIDGDVQPDPMWTPDLRSLHSLGCEPIVVALGLGTALEDALNTIKRRPGVACIAEEGTLPADLLRSIINSIIFSVVNTAGKGEFEFVLPYGMRLVS